jgi:hypothetical protein
MAVYSGDASRAPSSAVTTAGGSAGASAPTDEAASDPTAMAMDSAATGQPADSGLPIWAILLFLVAGAGGGSAAVALLPRLAPQLLHAA